MLALRSSRAASACSRYLTQAWHSPALWTLVLLLSLYLFTAGGDLFISDGIAMYRTTEAIVDHGTLAVAQDPLLPQILPGRDGRWYSMYDLGQPLAAVPFYLAGVAVAHLLPGMHRAALTLFSVSLLPQVATALTGLVLYEVARGLYRSQRVAVVVALLWGTATLAWPYSKLYFAEALVTLCLVAAAHLLFTGAEGPWRLGLGGVCLGAAVAVRATSAIYVPAFLLHLALAQRDGRAGATPLWCLARRWFVLALGLLPGVTLTLGHNYLRFHSLLLTGYQGQSFSTPLYVGLYGLLFSTGRSVFLYSPPVLLGLACLGRLRRTSQPVTGFVLAMLVAALLFYSGWWSWHGGWCWGPRFLVPLLPFLVLPVGTVLASRRGKLAALAVWVLGLLAVIPGVCVDFNAYIIDYMHGDYSLEPQMWFYPWASPLIGHWRYLLQGRALTLAGWRLSDHGLPWIVNRLYWPTLGSVAALAAGRLVRIVYWRKGARKPEARAGYGAKSAGAGQCVGATHPPATRTNCSLRHQRREVDD